MVRARLTIPLALLGAYALAFGAASLGTSLIVYDDHPGQLYRVWHVVTHGYAPWRWNDGWWAGYPELQFYPPGFAYAAASLHQGSFGTVSVEAAYQSMVWLTYLGPGVTTFLLLARMFGNGWLALPGAFLALTISAGITSGVEGGVHTGMVSARLGWAMLPLLALALHRWIAGERPISLAIAPLVAALTLTHPAHAPAAIALVLAGVVVGESRRRRFIAAAAALLAAVALTAFWTVPLLARLAETRALAWGRLTLASLADSLARHPLLVLLLLLAALAALLRRGPFETVIAGLPWLVTAVVIGDAVILEPLGLRWLPADRVVDGAWLAVVIAAGFAIGRVIEIAGDRTSAPAAALSLVVIATLVTVSLPGSALTLWPRRADWPTFPATARGLRLDELWSALGRAPAGRVLFLRSSVPLVYGTEWYRPHTHITSLTPVLTGRPIVHGTFTHPSPIAALVYRGTAGPGPITELAERLDGRSLFGRPLASLDVHTFDRYADRLGVTVVVALDEDAPHLGALDEHPMFVRARGAPPFVLWVRRDAISLPGATTDGRWTIRARGEAGRWSSVRIAYYPLWRASDNGAPLDTRRGEHGDLEIRLARPDAGLDLAYAPGAAEIAGVLVTALAAIVVGGIATRRRLSS